MTCARKGAIDIPALVKAMDGEDYDGLYAIEFDYLDPRFGDEDQALADNIEYLKTLQ